MAKDCPKCRLVNPAEAQRCDCGWDFVSGRQERSYVERKRVPVAAGIGIGVIVALVLLQIAVKWLVQARG